MYHTNDPFTFKINDFKLPSDLIVNKMSKHCPSALQQSPPSYLVVDTVNMHQASVVIPSMGVQATPVYRTNDPFTFKINDFKLPSDLVDDIVNKRYPACLAVLITESLELEGLWVPSASPNIKDKVN